MKEWLAAPVMHCINQVQQSGTVEGGPSADAQ